jgi:hypothetical protein
MVKERYPIRPATNCSIMESRTYGQHFTFLLRSGTYRFTGKPVSQATGLYYDKRAMLR